jgi:hypothetical protein
MTPGLKLSLYDREGNGVGAAWINEVALIRQLATACIQRATKAAEEQAESDARTGG